MTKQEAVNKIEATREDWTRAVARWRYAVQFDKRGTELNERQFGLQLQLEKNLKALNGEPVIISKNYDGNPWISYPYRGMILNAKLEGSTYIATVLFFPSDHEQWNGERIEAVGLWQIEQVRNVYMPTQEQLKGMRLYSIVSLINRSRKETVNRLVNEQMKYAATIRSLKKDLILYKKRLADTKEAVKNNQIKDLSKEEILKFFRQLEKNKKVVDAYINTAGEMIVETDMLYATTPDKLIVDKEKPVGRFIFNLSTKGIEYCRFANLDYCFHNSGGTHYPHPNVEGTKVCYGNNGALLKQMCQSGSFYELTDFLILFFSLFPHDEGTPHVRHERWMKERTVEKKSNPWQTTDRLWELHPDEKETKLKKEETKKEFRSLEEFIANEVNNEGMMVGGQFDNDLRARLIEAEQNMVRANGNRVYANFIPPTMRSGVGEGTLSESTLENVVTEVTENPEITVTTQDDDENIAF